jgi:hypothetical protein
MPNRASLQPDFELFSDQKTFVTVPIEAPENISLPCPTYGYRAGKRRNFAPAAVRQAPPSGGRSQRSGTQEFAMDSHASASWLANRPIQFKLMLAFAGVLLAFVGACIGIISALTVQSDTRLAMQGTTATVIAAQQLRNRMHEYEISVYGVLSDDSSAAALLEPARRRLDEATTELISRTSDNPALHARALLAHQRYRDWITGAIDPGQAIR